MNIPSVAIVLALIVGGGVLATSVFAPMSLATDLGYTDEDACAIIEARGATGIQRLKASGFPRPTTGDVEVYRLTRDDAPQLVLRIDWMHEHAQCLPHSYTPKPTVNVDLSERAYNALVGELTRVINGEGLSGNGIGNWLALWWGTDITIPNHPDSSAAYKRDVTLWAAGWLS